MRGLCGFVSLSRMGPRTRYPIQNLRASTKGTVVRVGQSFPVKERQEVAFLGRWWLIDNVGFDLSEYAPQSAAVTGIGHPKTFLDIVGQQVKGSF